MAQAIAKQVGLTTSLLMSFLSASAIQNCKKPARSLFVGDGDHDAQPLDRGCGDRQDSERILRLSPGIVLTRKWSNMLRAFLIRVKSIFRDLTISSGPLSAKYPWDSIAVETRLTTSIQELGRSLLWPLVLCLFNLTLLLNVAGD